MNQNISDNGCSIYRFNNITTVARPEKGYIYLTNLLTHRINLPNANVIENVRILPILHPRFLFETENIDMNLNMFSNRTHLRNKSCIFEPRCFVTNFHTVRFKFELDYPIGYRKMRKVVKKVYPPGFIRL